MPPKKRPAVKKEETQDFSNLVFLQPESLVKREHEDNFDPCDLSSEYALASHKRQKSTGDPSSKGPSMQLKAIKAREKALVDKFAAVQSNIQTPLEKDEGIVVDCLYLANERAAPVMLKEGPYKDHVAVVLKQSRPFPILDLPKEIRPRIFNYLLKDENQTIPITLKHGGTRTAYAPNYHDPNNLAILSTCKVIHEEVAPIAYGHKFQFAGTQVAATFLLQIGQFRRFIKSLEMDTYNGATASTIFRLLPDCPEIAYVKFNHISSNESPGTATKNMFNHARSWLCVPDKANPTKRLDILKFDGAAFHKRVRQADGGLAVVQWSDRDKVDFQRALRDKLEKYANSC
ncbi:hypothetical protein K491DRAFT_672782 [Lophiostoma macrostomum CBS 122681]|uniref:Uncharacterized protein n=1 Tax=Lophiostoma macrostomum CBS 122681 TaxID=1314788 RepID=A0A6A6TWD3_9PLEO|nr:hypothetical protein K491DRAFT_672782 [Lophiostoma macrostomum CBS 122681]